MTLTATQRKRGVYKPTQKIKGNPVPDNKGRGNYSNFF
jgi:hypothetical protein